MYLRADTGVITLSTVVLVQYNYIYSSGLTFSTSFWYFPRVFCFRILLSCAIFSTDHVPYLVI